MSDRGLINDHHDCWLNQLTIHPNDRTDAVEVTIPSVDVGMPTLSHSATTSSQQDKNIHNVSPVSDDIFCQPGPHRIEFKQQPTKDSPASPTPSEKGPNQLFKPYNFPNPHPLCNHHEKRQFNAVTRELKQLALHAHSKVQKRNFQVDSVRQTI